MLERSTDEAEGGAELAGADIGGGATPALLLIARYMIPAREPMTAIPIMEYRARVTGSRGRPAAEPPNGLPQWGQNAASGGVALLQEGQVGVLGRWTVF